MPAALLIVLALAAGQEPLSVPATRATVAAAEEARAATDAQLQMLVRTARHASPLQVQAIRALGRLERPTLVSELLPLLEAAQPAVRAEAADALAQSAGSDPAAVHRVREALMQRLLGETDAEATGAIGEALGRLPLGAAETALATEKALVDITRRVETASHIEKQAAGGRIVGLTLTRKKETAVPLASLVGALRGLESMARAKGKARQSFQPETIERLQALATTDPATLAGRQGMPEREADAARARRLAMLCLLPVNAVSASLSTRAATDPDEQVHRLAILSASSDRDTVGRGLKDPAWLVRYEALRAYGRRFRAAEGCAPVVSALADDSAHVSLLAIDLLAGPCGAADRAVERLVDLAAPGASSDAWHRPAHAIVSLAQAAPAEARRYLERFVTAENWHAKMYAAAAATHLGDAATLRTLAADVNDNVREAAIAALSKTVNHEGDDLYRKALGAGDHQLVMTAAGALAGTTDRQSAVPALVAALARLTALDSDTSRDPRLAVLDRLKELGTSDLEPTIAPYLDDRDPRVAARAAEILTAWTGRAATASTRPLPTAPPALTDADLARLSRTSVRVTMASGGTFEIRLMADFAPASCARFVELVSAGYYTGLTFHRILPNFLIQGGSPGANEFSGHRRFWRDEPGRVMQARGTVGTSTRGRDTGDGQIYVNLVDTPRLDHEYSIFGEVSRGMDVVDKILEGDVMKSLEVVVK